MVGLGSRATLDKHVQVTFDHSDSGEQRLSGPPEVQRDTHLNPNQRFPQGSLGAHYVYRTRLAAAVEDHDFVRLRHVLPQAGEGRRSTCIMHLRLRRPRVKDKVLGDALG